jgi:hypothetical protein
MFYQRIKNSFLYREPFTLNDRAYSYTNLFFSRRIFMKKLSASLMILSASLFAGQALAHHAAAGIVSDDIWERIDDQLEAADSPHLDMEFTMMDNTILTTVEVETEMVPDVLGTISSVNNGTLMVSTQETGRNLTTITIVETVGSGRSQIIYQ